MVVEKKLEHDTNNLRSTCAQVTAALVFSILSINVGFILCMPTIVIGALRSDNSMMALSESQASWFGSLMYITQPIGSLISGLAQDPIGRRRSLQLINIPLLVAWLIVYFSSSVNHLYTAMVLFGLSLGFLEAPVMSYTGEVTQPRLRGVLSCLTMVLYNLGFMGETILGAVVPWRTMVLWNSFGPLVGFIAISLVTAALVFSILSANVGFILCMPTIVIGALRTDNSTMALSENQASWFGSLMFITQPIGSLTSGLAQDTIGRRRCLQLINVPQLVAWLIVYFSSSVNHLYAAMVLFGLSMGFLEAPVLSYIGEVTQPRLRGVLSCFSVVLYNLGFMGETFLGAVLPWRTMVLWSAFSPLVGFIAMSLLPESPAWLVTKGRVREAERAYQWLRGWVSRKVVQPELEDMINYVKDTQGTKKLYSGDYKPVATNEGTTAKKPMKGRFESILEPGVLRAFRIVLFYYFIMACASLFAMRPFFIDILKNLNLNLPIGYHSIVTICGALQAVGSISMGIILRPLGKRGVSFLSLGLSVFCCLGLGFYLVSGLTSPWIPVTLFALSYFAASLGIIAIPWILTIELFPLRARGLAGGICGAAAYVFFFLVTKTYYNLEAWLQVSGTCFFYGAIGVLGLVYLYLDLPETEGVTLEEIEMRMSERSPKRVQKQFVEIQRKEEV